MPSRAPRHDATKKREQLSQRKKALLRAIRAQQSHAKMLDAAEEYRASQLSYLKAKLHWANEALIVDSASLGKGVGNLRAKAAGVTAQSDVERLGSEIASWSRKSAEDVLREASLA